MYGYMVTKVLPILTDDTTLAHIEEVLPKLGDTPTQKKLVDICLRLRYLLRQMKLEARPVGQMGPKRNRAAYMRNYRARTKLKKNST
jgi:hypothetical protein